MSLNATKRIVAPLTLLAIPLFGTIFFKQVNWSVFDFLIMGSLLLIIGLGVHFIVEKIKNKKQRWVYLIYLILIFLILWAELAVGIFGSPLAGN